MKSFNEYLAEQKKFGRGKDQDFTVDDKYVLCFVKNDKETYHPTSDKTHDASSHAIKHLGEFEPQFMKSVLQQAEDYVKQYLTKNPQQFCAVLSSSGTFVATDKAEVTKKIDVYILGNTLDLINDKVLTKKPLIQIEKDLTQFTRKIKDKYVAIIDQKMKESIDLDKVKEEELEKTVKSAKIIKFNGWQSVAQEYYLDFSDNSIIICTPDYIRTLYKFDRDASSKREVVKNFFSKRFEVDNKKIQNILRNI